MLNDPDYVSLVADTGVTYPILRIKQAGSMDDDNLHMRHASFKDWWKQVKPLYSDKRVLVHVNNEPGNDDNKRLARFTLDAMEILSNEGYRGVVLNHAVGNPEPELWQNELAPVLDGLRNQYRGTMTLGSHEYWMLYPELGIQGYGLTENKQLFGAPTGNKFDILRRWERVGPGIKVIFTEWGVDYIPALAVAVGRDIRGLKTHKQMWETLGIRTEDQITALFNRAVKLHNHPNIIGACYFSVGNSGGWDDYNLENNWWLLEKGLWQMATKDVFIRSTSANGTRIRDGASTVTGRVLASLPNVDVAAQLLSETDEWYQISVTLPSQSRVITGWVNKSVVVLTTSGEPTPVNEIVFPEFTINIANADENEREIFRKVAQAQENLWASVRKQLS